MKLSNILKTKGIKSTTIHDHHSYTVAQIFVSGRSKPILKVSSKINMDINVPEISNHNVKHLGIKRYFHLVTDEYYVNYYIY
jgi:hypothetical protein